MLPRQSLTLCCAQVRISLQLHKKSRTGQTRNVYYGLVPKFTDQFDDANKDAAGAVSAVSAAAGAAPAVSAEAGAGTSDAEMIAMMEAQEARAAEPEQMAL